MPTDRPHPGRVGGVALTAIVASHRPGDHLACCLASLASEQLDVVVVDDGSAAGVASAVARGFPRVRIVRSAQNRGFAASANAGLAEILHSAPESERPAWVLLLNDDATLEPGFCAVVSPHLLTPEPWSMLAALRLRDDDPERIDSAGLVLTAEGDGTDWLADEPCARAPRMPVEILGPSAGAALYRLELLAGLGGFEASFTAYFEDLDLALRARARGARALLLPDARVRHRGGTTTRTRAYRRLVWLERNRLRTVVRHFPRALAVGCIGRAIRSAVARAVATTAGTRHAGGTHTGSGVSSLLAAVAHVEGWTRAALNAPSDLWWRTHGAPVVAPAELRRWIAHRGERTVRAPCTPCTRDRVPASS